MFYPEKFPSLENATPQAVASGGLRLCLETDTAIQQHVDRLSRGKGASRPTPRLQHSTRSLQIDIRIDFSSNRRRQCPIRNRLLYHPSTRFG